MAKKAKSSHIRVPNPVALALYTTPNAFRATREMHKKHREERRDIKAHRKPLTRHVSHSFG